MPHPSLFEGWDSTIAFRLGFFRTPTSLSSEVPRCPVFPHSGKKGGALTRGAVVITGTHPFRKRHEKIGAPGR